MIPGPPEERLRRLMQVAAFGERLAGLRKMARAAGLTALGGGPRTMRWRIVNCAEPLLVYGEIGETASAGQVSAEIDRLSGGVLRVLIDSPGGWRCARTRG